MIKLSTKVRYGTRAMIDICLHCGAAPVLARDVAQRQGVSKKYLDSLLRELTSKGLLRSQRGTGGGDGSFGQLPDHHGVFAPA